VLKRSRNTRKPGPVPGFFCLLLASACNGPPAPTAQQGIGAELSLAGHVENEDLSEISGMARSQRDPELLWVHNDSGDKARLHAIDTSGRERGRLKLEDADNRDWEDLASFSLDGKPYLLVADTGNNEGRHELMTLYVVAEPDLAADDRIASEPEWRIDFRYPDGPRDAEAVAVDVEEGRVYIVSKRDLPPVLYRVPLRPADAEPVQAERVGEITTLPQPARGESEFAPVSHDWYWQPTAMDFAPDGSFIALLTYGAVYYFERSDAGTAAALAARPLRFDLRRLKNAEALAVGNDGKRLFLTVEQRSAPLLRIDLSFAAREVLP
jgi:hypothetical protein